MAKSRPFPFTAYTGDIGHGERTWPIRFLAGSGADGELRFLARPMPYNAETAELSRIWHAPGQTVPFFRLEGVSSDGVRFSSEHMRISSLGKETTPTRTVMKPKLQCSRGVFRSTPEDAGARRFLRYSLRGFSAFPPVEAECRLGAVAMQGMHPLPPTERISGYLQVVAPQSVADFPAWREEADRLCLHLQRYMSFAASRLIRAPMTEVWNGQIGERIHLSQTKRSRAGQPVIHPMKLQVFFERAVEAFFDPPIPVLNPTYALEWFAMDAGYTETRLLNVMTALENLTASNLPEPEILFLPKSRFNTLAKAMRNAARACLADNPTDGDTTLEDDWLEILPGRMQDLNRRSLKDKIRLLAARWQVPLEDLVSDETFAAAINARNAIVHRGWYYEPDADSPEHRDLWDHVLLMREILIRFVLTSLRYTGDYLSFRGGQHDVVFPPGDR